MPQTRYVITRPYPASGVGSNLASLAGAVWIAGRLGRTLVVDWRGVDVLHDKGLNFFTRFFEAGSKIEGVPIAYPGDDGIPDAGRPEDADPAVLWTHAADAYAIATGARALERPILGLQSYHALERIAPRLPLRERCAHERRVYRTLALAEPLRTEVDAWHARHLRDRFVVGVNVRTGNGDFARGSLPRGRVDVSILGNEERFLRRLRRACDARARRTGRPRDGYTIFFATDSFYGRDLLSRLEGAVTRRERFPPRGAGVHVAAGGDGYTDVDASADAVADMFLLARCDALVFNFSMFNQYARVVTGFYGGNQQNIESLYARYWIRRAANVARRARAHARAAYGSTTRSTRT